MWLDPRLCTLDWLGIATKRLKIHEKIQGTSRLSKQVVEIIVRPNPKPMDLFTIPAADCAIFC